MTQPLTVALIGFIVWRFQELAPLFAAHLEDHEGEVLPHVFMAQIERWAESLLSNRGDELRDFLGVLADAYESGDGSVRNLIDVSFVEELPYPDEANSEIRGLLPNTLRALLRHGI